MYDSFYCSTINIDGRSDKTKAHHPGPKNNDRSVFTHLITANGIQHLCGALHNNNNNNNNDDDDDDDHRSIHTYDLIRPVVSASITFTLNLSLSLIQAPSTSHVGLLTCRIFSAAPISISNI
mmetsp:Transcript_34363/g.82794  ORF Transcript_34363/g.82794 Transcript_34363/m.82794 type:complete len:122 (+) Transcript_34363:1234-1599(+)